MSPKPEQGALRFRHGALAAALLLGIAVLVGGLDWWNTRRGEAELSALRGKLCGELPQALQSGLADLARVTDPEIDTDERVLALLAGLVQQRGEPGHDVRILQRTTKGWREWRPHWQVDWVYEPPLLDLLAQGDCGSSLEDGETRVVRRYRTGDGSEFLLVTQRHRS